MGPASGRTRRQPVPLEKGSQAERDQREALGRSRGGYGTKACVIADGLGRAVAFILAPGQAHELPQAIPLLDRLPGVPKWVVADRGLSSHAFREHIWERGARPAIPTKDNEAPVACPDWIYQSQPSRAALGNAQGVARDRDPLRENRLQLHGCPLSRRHTRLAQ